MDVFEDAFKAVGIPALLTYAMDMADIASGGLVDQEISQNNGFAYILQAGQDLDAFESEFINDTRGCMSHSRFFMHTFGREQKKTFNKSQEWLIKAWITSEDVLGPPNVFPFDFPRIGDADEVANEELIKIWRFHPVGGVVKPVKSGGDHWVVSQPIEFAAQEN